MILLQNQNTARELSNRLPSFDELVTYYGPYLGLLIGLVIAILILLFVWFNKVLKAKNEEIKRAVEREQQLNERVLHLIDQEIGYRKRKSTS